MTPADFHVFVNSTAVAASAGTGIDPIVLEAQWANETAWGTAIFGNNLGNIRCSPTSFCLYATLDDFAQAAIAVWHQTAFINNAYPNGFEPFRAAAAAGTPAQALAAICASPWSSGHYGGSLDAFYQPLEVFDVLTPDEHNRLFAQYDGMFGDPATSAYAKLYWQRVAAAVVQVGGGSLTPAQAQELQEAHDAVLRIEAGLKGA